jgi:hypothetical protein
LFGSSMVFLADVASIPTPVLTPFRRAMTSSRTDGLYIVPRTTSPGKVEL